MVPELEVIIGLGGHSIDLPPDENYDTKTAQINNKGELFLERTFGKNTDSITPYIATEINKEHFKYLERTSGESSTLHNPNELIERQYRFKPAIDGVENKVKPGTVEYDAFEKLINHTKKRLALNLKIEKHDGKYSVKLQPTGEYSIRNVDIDNNCALHLSEDTGEQGWRTLYKWSRTYTAGSSPHPQIVGDAEFYPADLAFIFSNKAQPGSDVEEGFKMLTEFYMQETKLKEQKIAKNF